MSAAAHQADPAPPDPDASGEPSARPLPVRIARAAAGAIGFAATFFGLLFLLFPALQPAAPEEPKAAGPSKRRAWIRNPVVEALNLGSSLDRRGLERGSYSAADLAQRGVFLQFDIDVQGFKNERLRLRWQLIDDRGDQLTNSTNRTIVPTADEDRGHHMIWIDLGRLRPRGACVKLELYGRPGEAALDGRTSPCIRLRT